jgi:hypothetical protein
MSNPLVTGSLFLALICLPHPVYSQGEPSGVEQSVRQLVVDMRAAAEAGNWPELEPYFPTTGAWAKDVESLVTGKRQSGRAVFWHKHANVDLDELEVVAVRADSVLTGVEFVYAGEPIYWGATFVLRDGEWRLHCAAYGYGEGPFGPGCSTAAATM